VQQIKQKAVEDYLSEKITLSEAATKANLTIWEMEKCLIDRGFKSQYSIEDLDKELKNLD